METVKRCSRCRKEKEEVEFKAGCRVCILCSDACRKSQQDNPEKAREKCQRYYEKKREDILDKKREKTWCDLCEMYVVKDQYQRHTKTIRHQHYLKLEEGEESEVEDAKNKFWCETCRIWLSKKTRTSHYGTPRHLELAQRRRDSTA